MAGKTRKLSKEGRELVIQCLIAGMSWTQVNKRLAGIGCPPLTRQAIWKYRQRPQVKRAEEVAASSTNREGLEHREARIEWYRMRIEDLTDWLYLTHHQAPGVKGTLEFRTAKEIKAVGGLAAIYMKHLSELVDGKDADVPVHPIPLTMNHVDPVMIQVLSDPDPDKRYDALMDMAKAKMLAREGA